MRYQSNRVAQIPPAALIESGVDVIDLGIGDPDLPTFDSGRNHATSKAYVFELPGQSDHRDC